MVDLAKIRKKAKKVLGVPESSSLPVVESPSEPPPAPPSVSTTGRLEDLKTSKLERFKEQAGKRRETVKTEQVEQAAGTQLELLTFLIAGEHYAVDIERIVEIVTPRSVTRIPNADPSVVGIISLRGTIVTLVDVRRKLRHAAGSATPDTRIVVIDFRNETVGFVVDRVQRVVKIAATALEPHPVVHSAELEESIRGVFRVSGALTILLDLDKLLDHTPWT
jgi:purine-binding chemotaxis protein CheW